MSTKSEAGIPALLKEVRGDRRKQDMAGELGTTPASYGRWERGDFPFPVEHLPWLADQAGAELADVEAMWKLDAGSRALRRAAPGDTDDVLRQVVESQAQIAAVLGDLVERVSALEPPKPKTTRRPARKA